MHTAAAAAAAVFASRYDGSVLLYGDGDFTRERMGLGALTGNKGGKLVHEGADPVTGLAFRDTGRELVLFVVTSSKVLSYCVQRKDNHVEELDSIGGEIKCSVAAGVANGLVVARTEGVYAYEQDARGFALGVEGDKKMLTTFRNYLVIVGREQKRTDASVAVNKVNTVTIYDPANKFVAFGAGFNDVQYVLNEWGAIYILAGDGKIYTLTEKDFQTKLDMLFKKHLYAKIPPPHSRAAQAGDAPTPPLLCTRCPRAIPRRCRAQTALARNIISST